jgi:hypothetical protein
VDPPNPEGRPQSTETARKERCAHLRGRQWPPRLPGPPPPLVEPAPRSPSLLVIKERLVFARLLHGDRAVEYLYPPGPDARGSDISSRSREADARAV